MLIPILLTFARAADHYDVVSPNHRFEAYTTPRNPEGTGMRLLLRLAGDRQPGVLLRENDRWIEARWSPDSRYLAMIDGSDGHVTDVFVYRATSLKRASPILEKPRYFTFQSGGDIAELAIATGVRAELCYHTPHLWTYDVQWGVRGWDLPRGLILLTKDTREGKIKVQAALDTLNTR